VFKASDGFGTVTVEDAEALGGRLALRLAVGDRAARWSEEGAADVQDGNRHPPSLRGWATLPLRGARFRSRGVRAALPDPGGP
jgi:hypothetical protein